MRVPATASRWASTVPGCKPWAEPKGREPTSGFTCFWGHCDNIVFPTRSATLPGADNRHLVQTPHVAMTFHPEVFGYVLQSLGAG